jgi:hypothetical protein
MFREQQSQNLVHKPATSLESASMGRLKGTITSNLHTFLPSIQPSGKTDLSAQHEGSATRISDLISCDFLKHASLKSNYRFNLVIPENKGRPSRSGEISRIEAFGRDSANSSDDSCRELKSSHLLNKEAEALKNQTLLEQYETICQGFFTSKNKFKDQGSQAANQEEQKARGTVEEPLELPDPEKLLEEARKSAASSKKFIRLIHGLSPAKSAPFIQLVEQEMASLIQNENTCYIVKYFLKVSEPARLIATSICSSSLELMLEKQHTSRVVYTLCNNSADFREILLGLFRRKMLRLISSLAGAILLSLLIQNVEDSSKYYFVFEELRRNHDLIRTEYFGRAFASFMTFCPADLLDEIAKIFRKNLLFMVHNIYGNHLLQIFFERQNPTGMRLCESILKKICNKAVVRKYSRYVLLKAILSDSKGDFTQEILVLTFENQALLESIVQKKMSSMILLLCLAKCKSAAVLSRYLGSLNRIQKKMESHNGSKPAFEEFFKELETFKSRFNRNLE